MHTQKAMEAMISEINSPTSRGDVPESKDNDALDRNDFLNLLVVQLRNQDPINPLQSAEFSAQLAQFSSLEQLTNINTAIQSLIDQQAAAANGQAVGYIGKQVKAVGNTVQITEGGSVECHFKLLGAAENALVYIKDAGASPVRVLELNPKEVKEGRVIWDGTDNEGKPVDEGLYSFEVVAVDKNQQRVAYTPYMLADVTGVSWKNGSTVLMAGNREIPLVSVIEVRLAEPGDLEAEAEFPTEAMGAAVADPASDPASDTASDPASDPASDTAPEGTSMAQTTSVFERLAPEP